MVKGGEVPCGGIGEKNPSWGGLDRGREVLRKERCVAVGWREKKEPCWEEKIKWWRECEGMV